MKAQPGPEDYEANPFDHITATIKVLEHQYFRIRSFRKYVIRKPDEVEENTKYVFSIFFDLLQNWKEIELDEAKKRKNRVIFK